MRDVRGRGGEPTDDADLVEQIAASIAANPPATPCPRCDARLPLAVARIRHWWDQWPAVFGPVALVFALPVSLMATLPWVYWLLAVLAPAVVAAELYWVCRVGRRVPSPAGRPGPNGEPVPADPAPARGWAYASLAAAVLALLAHPVCRVATRSPLNERCSPMVVSPGTRVHIDLENDLRSVKGEWGGTGQAVILGEDGHPNLPELTVKAPPPPMKVDEMRIPKDEGGKTPRTRLEVTLPEDPALAGKTLRLRLDLTVTYPKLLASGQFEYRSALLSEERDLVLVTESERTTDQTVMLAGALLGIFFTFLGSVLVLWSDRLLRLSAPQPRVEVAQVEEDFA